MKPKKILSLIITNLLLLQIGIFAAENTETEYAITNPIIVEDFYQDNTNLPQTQHSLPDCVSAATFGAIGYLMYGNTQKLSQVDNNFATYLYKNKLFSKSSFQGASWGAGSLFNYLMNNGYYVALNEAEALNDLKVVSDVYSKNKKAIGDDSSLVLDTLLNEDPEFINCMLKSEEQRLIVNPDAMPYRLEYKQLFNSYWKSAFRVTDQIERSKRTELIKASIDKEDVVLIMFKFVYGTNVQNRSSYYDKETKRIVSTAFTEKYNLKNTFEKIDGLNKSYTIGGDHWVFIFGYGYSKDGEIMFIARNSWGQNNSFVDPYGNIYLAESYINGTWHSGANLDEEFLIAPYAASISRK